MFKVYIVGMCAILLVKVVGAQLVIGTYTKTANEGFNYYNFNAVTADVVLETRVGIKNASYLALQKNGAFLYAVSELADSTAMGKTGYIVAYSFNKSTKKFTLLNTQLSGGTNPCYITLSKNNKWLFVANYSSGTVAFYPVNKNGGIDSVKQIIQHIGASINKGRQNEPHAHAVVLSNNNKYLYVCDLGIDKIMTYRFNGKKGILKLVDSAVSAPGAGPRHIIMHPNNKFAYAIEELSGNVVAYKTIKGKLSMVQTISSLPVNYKGAIGSADIHISPNEKFLYCSNRGASNSITTFGINRKNGTLTYVANQSTLGIKPRNFNIHPTGNYLLVANQDSNEVVIFTINKTTGVLTDSGKRIKLPMPVYINWMQ